MSDDIKKLLADEREAKKAAELEVEERRHQRQQERDDKWMNAQVAANAAEAELGRQEHRRLNEQVAHEHTAAIIMCGLIVRGHIPVVSTAQEAVRIADVLREALKR
jgi:hypothetical protein